MESWPKKKKSLFVFTLYSGREYEKVKQRFDNDNAQSLPLLNSELPIMLKTKQYNRNWNVACFPQT